MTKEDIGKINSLTFDWLYHEQELRRGSDEKYHKAQQIKDEKLLVEMMTEIVTNKQTIEYGTLQDKRRDCYD